MDWIARITKSSLPETGVAFSTVDDKSSFGLLFACTMNQQLKQRKRAKKDVPNLASNVIVEKSTRCSTQLYNHRYIVGFKSVTDLDGLFEVEVHGFALGHCE